ncbi:hypothetical protein [Herbaspirillum frisingense]|uniref:Uncharacterized protein n=1 Tax=Herbaspirillum frisingense TaxID=92645 RepID=A0ABU1PCX8_9BURK|nr:hypothetical protein [Herbaspirillum frisingense]MDR6583781.1 hypothetical protein [Herbaspirillum frisingense]
MSTRVRSRLKKAGRNFKRLDFPAMPLSHFPAFVEDTFRPIEQLLVELETTGETDCDRDGAVYRAPSDGQWYCLAGALSGFVEFFEAYGRLVDRVMPVAALGRLANKFGYGTMVFQSDIDDVRFELDSLRAEANLMTSGQARSILASMTEEACTI